MRRSALAIVLAIILAGCGIQAAGSSAPDQHFVFEQELPDGQTVLCVWASWGTAGGPSCDWESVRR